MNELKIGVDRTGRPFKLKDNAAVETFAILGIRGSGKTTTAAVMAEEMYKAGLPWICLDPVGVWWGLRSTPTGGAGGHKVVVIGGDHGDIPLVREGGRQIARALMSEPVCAVIDLSKESKRFWHTFVTDFADELMLLEPEVPRHIFIEEAPEFLPQRSSHELSARTKEAVERLIRLGRNHGYGCTLISQRPARVDKDALSQMANLFVMRTIGKHDRDALTDWIEANASDKGLEKFLKDLATLPSGTAWYWSPHWMEYFEKVRIRQRETFHPGATRESGKAMRAATLTDVGEFVAKLKLNIAAAEKKRQLPVAKPGKAGPAAATPSAPPPRPAAEDEVIKLRVKVRDLEGRLDRVRKVLAPQHQAMVALFGELGSSNGTGTDASAYEPWLAKAKRASERRMLEVLIERRELTRAQFATLAVVKKSTFNAGLSFLRRNGLCTVEGDMVKLADL